MEDSHDLEGMARGFVREVLGHDLIEWLGEKENEEEGTAYHFHVRQLPGQSLKLLKERFEVVEVLPGDKPHGFEVFVKRRR